MKKICIAVVAAVCAAGLFSAAFAQAQKAGEEEVGMMPGGMMGTEAMMMHKDKTVRMGGIRGMMMHPMMMGSSLVATEDGGIVVMFGNKLMKYDKDLNLKKEVELKIDREYVQKMWKQMMGCCYPSKVMMQKGTTEQGKAEE